MFKQLFKQHFPIMLFRQPIFTSKTYIHTVVRILPALMVTFKSLKPSSHAPKFFVTSYENSMCSFIHFLTKKIRTCDYPNGICTSGLTNIRMLSRRIAYKLCSQEIVRMT